jgi:hypothetical protein
MDSAAQQTKLGKLKGTKIQFKIDVAGWMTVLC